VTAIDGSRKSTINRITCVDNTTNGECMQINVSTAFPIVYLLIAAMLVVDCCIVVVVDRIANDATMRFVSYGVMGF
jgi:hypothetical protein